MATACGNGRQQQALCHGGAGTVQPQMGNAGIAQGKGRADALVQKISGIHQIHILRSDARLIQKGIQSKLLHFLLRLFPAFL